MKVKQTEIEQDSYLVFEAIATDALAVGFEQGGVDRLQNNVEFQKFELANSIFFFVGEIESHSDQERE